MEKDEEKKSRELLTAVVNRKKFLSAIDFLRVISFKKATLPVLSHALLRVGNEDLMIAGTNLEISIQQKIPASNCKKGEVSVPAKLLFDILKGFSGEEVLLEGMENLSLKIKTEGGEFGIVGSDPDEFPVFPIYDDEKFKKIDHLALTEMVDKTAFAASKTESGHYCTHGLLFCNSKDGLLRVVGTDGHRLALIQKWIGTVLLPESGIIFPKSAVLVLQKFMVGTNRLFFQVDKLNIFFKKNNDVLIVRLIDGKFPEYERVISKKLGGVAIVDRVALFSSLKSMSVLNPLVGVKLSFKGKSLTLSVVQSDFGEAKKTIDVDYSGEEFEIGFNPVYVMDALNSLSSDRVIIKWGPDVETPPCLFVPEQKNSGQLHVVMPMRL